MKKTLILLLLSFLVHGSFASAAEQKRKNAQFNLKNAEIGAVIETIAELTGRNFIVDPKVKGKVTIISGREMSVEDLYQVFLSVLQVHGYVAISDGTVTKIVPDAGAKYATNTLINDYSGEGKTTLLNDDYVTQVIEVDNISAAKLVPILRPMISPKGHLVSHAPTNTLIVSDHMVNIAHLLKIINRIDQESSSDLDIVTLEYAASSDLVRVLNQLRQKDKEKSASASSAVVIADERTNSILISGDKSERLQIKAIIAHLDTPMESSGDTEVVYLRYAKSKELAAILSGLGKDYIKEKKKQKGKAPSTSPIVNVHAYEAANALVINAPPELMKSMKAVLRQLDIRRAQVLVEVIIAEINSTNDKSIGSQLVLDGTPGNGPIGVVNFGSLMNYASLASGSGSNFLSGGETISKGLSLGIGTYDSGTVNFGLLLAALETDDDTNILSTPSIITMDNEEANIFVGEEIAVQKGETTNTTGTTNNYARKKVGIKLAVTPQINMDDTVTLSIKQSVDDLSGYDSNDQPKTSERDIDTTVQIDNGEIIVLGGLMKEFYNENENKIPLLGDLPIIGAAFRSRTAEVIKTNLMVFIRPMILRDSKSSLLLTHQKYDSFRDLQQMVGMNGKKLLSDEVLPVLPEFDEMITLPPAFLDTQQPTTKF